MFDLHENKVKIVHGEISQEVVGRFRASWILLRDLWLGKSNQLFTRSINPVTARYCSRGGRDCMTIEIEHYNPWSEAKRIRESWGQVLQQCQQTNVLAAAGRLRRLWDGEDLGSVYPQNSVGFGEINDMKIVSKAMVADADIEGQADDSQQDSGSREAEAGPGQD